RGEGELAKVHRTSRMAPSAARDGGGEHADGVDRAGTDPHGRAAQACGVQSQRLCRSGIAKNTRLMAELAFDPLDACHRRSNRGKPTGDCNTFGDQTEATEADRGALRSVQGINSSFVCPQANPVFENYPAASPLGSMVLAPAVIGTVGASGAELQGPPSGAPVP